MPSALKFTLSFLFILQMGTATAGNEFPSDFPLCLRGFRNLFRAANVEGIYTGRHPYTRLTGAETFHIVANHAMAGDAPILLDLRQSLAKAGENPEAIGRATLGDTLNGWAQRNHLPWRFVLGNDLRQVARSYLEKGVISNADLADPPGWAEGLDSVFPEGGAGGYIPSKFWNLMVSDGIWPITNHHDVVSRRLRAG